tara:strand:+ start:751 stop:1320 length:570 start_codon:yes stop_codon:yes gene_type:complete
MNRKHTHKGHCQCCGRVQAVRNNNGLMAKHGYTVDYGFFEGVCQGSDNLPLEVEKDLAEDTIVVMKDWCANKTSLINHLVENKATITHYFVCKDKEGNITDIDYKKRPDSMQFFHHVIYNSDTFSDHVKSYNEHGRYSNALRDAQTIYAELHKNHIASTKRDVANANAHIVQLQKMIEEIHGKPLIAAA